MLQISISGSLHSTNIFYNSDNVNQTLVMPDTSALLNDLVSDISGNNNSILDNNQNILDNINDINNLDISLNLLSTNVNNLDTSFVSLLATVNDLSNIVYDICGTNFVLKIQNISGQVNNLVNAIPTISGDIDALELLLVDVSAAAHHLTDNLDASFGKVDISSNLTVDGSLDVNGDVSLNSNVDISGNLNLNGNVEAVGSVVAGSNIVAGGNLIVQDNAALNGMVDISYLNVLNNLNARGKTYLMNDAEISGNILPVNTSSQLGTGTYEFNELHVKDINASGVVSAGTVTAGGSVVAGTNVVANNNLTVLGDVSLNNNVDIVGELTIDGNNYKTKYNTLINALLDLSSTVLIDISGTLDALRM
tara:strand:+ start:667 stop:1758 length:1092 start_codon:yes stop_codon:yes gene_type:complete